MLVIAQYVTVQYNHVACGDSLQSSLGFTLREMKHFLIASFAIVSLLVTCSDAIGFNCEFESDDEFTAERICVFQPHNGSQLSAWARTFFNHGLPRSEKIDGPE